MFGGCKGTSAVLLLNGHIAVLGVAAVEIEGTKGDGTDDGGADIPDDTIEATSVSGVFDVKGTAGGGVLIEIFTGRTDGGELSNPGTTKLFPDMSIEGRTLELVEFSGSKNEFRFFTGNTLGCSWGFGLVLSGTGVALLVNSVRKFCLNDASSSLLALGLVFRY